MSHLWNKKNVPHKNWTNITVDDLGKGNYIQCEMCGKEGIRYAHVMGHQNYKNLNVGGVCAEKMCKEYSSIESLKSFHKRQRKLNKIKEVQ